VNSLSGAVEEIASLGGFFTVATHAAGAAPAPGWSPMGELTDTAVMAARVHAVRVALATAGRRSVAGIELRVAASVAHLGLVARIVSPMVAVAAISGRQLPMDLARLRWRNELGGAFPLSVGLEAPRPSTGPTPSPDVARDTARDLAEGSVAAISAAISAVVPVSPRILAGNVASAVNAAASTLARRRPDVAVEVTELTGRILAGFDSGAGNGRFGDDFRRASCCLIYRLALRDRSRVDRSRVDRSGLCRDCVLNR
jgi:hypothetical protein